MALFVLGVIVGGVLATIGLLMVMSGRDVPALPEPFLADDAAFLASVRALVGQPLAEVEG